MRRPWVVDLPLVGLGLEGLAELPLDHGEGRFGSAFQGAGGPLYARARSGRPGRMTTGCPLWAGDQPPPGGQRPGGCSALPRSGGEQEQSLPARGGQGPAPCPRHVSRTAGGHPRSHQWPASLPDRQPSSTGSGRARTGRWRRALVSPVPWSRHRCQCQAPSR